jgi:hypothetical protein
MSVISGSFGGDTLPIVELISPLTEGVSSPFLSLFELIFDAGGGSGDIGDVLRLIVIQVEFLDLSLLLVSLVIVISI